MKKIQLLYNYLLPNVDESKQLTLLFSLNKAL